MTDYSYAQLEGLWINAGGPRDQAATAAAIAEAESGGNSDARNPSGASGLWQILGNPFPGNAFDPATNARMAVAKYKEAPGGGDNFSPWVTFTDGSYRGYMSGKTTPDSNVPGSPSSVQAAAAAGAQTDCLVANPVSLPVVGSLGPSCLLSRSNARAFIGAGLVLAGGLAGLAALVVLAAAAGMKAAGPAGKVAEGVGGAMLLVPGLEPAGAAVAGAGATAKQVGAGRGQQVAAKRQRRAAADEKAMMRQLGEPRENNALEVRGGAVREDTGQRAARRSRERAAAADVPPF
jgi:hypothetical protein